MLWSHADTHACSQLANIQSVMTLYSSPCSSAICTLDIAIPRSLSTAGKAQIQQIIMRMLMESGNPAVIHSSCLSQLSSDWTLMRERVDEWSAPADAVNVFMNGWSAKLSNWCFARGCADSLEGWCTCGLWAKHGEELCFNHAFNHLSICTLHFFNVICWP